MDHLPVSPAFVFYAASNQHHKRFADVLEGDVFTAPSAMFPTDTIYFIKLNDQKAVNLNSMRVVMAYPQMAEVTVVGLVTE